jgi:hypothetical protein
MLSCSRSFFLFSRCYLKVLVLKIEYMLLSWNEGAFLACVVGLVSITLTFHSSYLSLLICADPNTVSCLNTVKGSEILWYFFLLTIDGLYCCYSYVDFLFGNETEAKTISSVLGWEVSFTLFTFLLQDGIGSVWTLCPYNVYATSSLLIGCFIIQETGFHVADRGYRSDCLEIGSIAQSMWHT